jgi:Domain of unknown function (DUF4274)
MTQIDYARLSKIRPGLTRLEAKELLGQPTHGLYRSIILGFGLSPEFNPNGKDTSDTLEGVIFGEKFPPEIDLYGLRLGMTKEEAGEAFRTLQLTPSQKFPDSNFEGWTPDNYRVRIWFMREGGAPTSDVWRLNGVWLSYPYTNEYIEARTALRQKLVAQAEQKRKRANAWKDITDDDDAMLMDWATHCKPWNDYFESQFVAYAKWLKQASPEERHMAACCWNWNFGLAPILWIIRQPDCDIATALKVYFACDPAYFLKFNGERNQVVSVNMESFDLLIELKSRLELGYYKRSNIAFEGRNALDRILRSNPTRMQIEATIPSNIKDYYHGRVISDENSYGGLKMPEFGF